MDKSPPNTDNMEPTHTKHAKLARPATGLFGRNEWAILGTPCGNIQRLAFALIERLQQHYAFAYVDADHAAADAAATQGSNAHSALSSGAMLEYTDKITLHRFDWQAKMHDHQYRYHYNAVDVVLVNGNHFQANRQIVVIDPKKEASLLKRLPQLTNIELVLRTEPNQAIYPFLQEKLQPDTPVLELSDIEGIAAFLKKQLAQTLPPLYGLVLAGGESRRMGEDKGALAYHAKPQREHAADLLNSFCKRTFLSCRPKQQIDTAYPVISDTFLDLGPYGAILSAFRQYPDAAWLVVACDLPLLDAAALQQLLEQRHRSKIATAFHNPETNFPEPLITIWEPRAYPVLLQWLAQGHSCPRKVLINSDIQIVQAANPTALRNVNAPAERDAVLAILKKSTL